MENNNYYFYDYLEDNETNYDTKYVTTKTGPFYKEEINTENNKEYYICIELFRVTLDELINYTKSLISENKNCFIDEYDGGYNRYYNSAKEYLEELNKRKEHEINKEKILTDPKLRKEILNKWLEAEKFYLEYFQIAHEILKIEDKN